MSADQQSRARSRWLALLALPILCCVGHVILLTAGVGSLVAVTGALTGRVILVAAGLALAVVGLVVVLRGARRR